MANLKWRIQRNSGTHYPKQEERHQNGKLEGIVKVYYDSGKYNGGGAIKTGTPPRGVSKCVVMTQEGNVTIEYESTKMAELIKNSRFC